tara:strand:- start:2162 stop:2644 length:483 start_codon:yes stop_codon:yes gene_type:complete
MDYRDIQEIFQQILERRFKETKVRSVLSGDGAPMKSIQELFFYAKFDIRFYALASKTQIEAIWDYVRGDEHKLDLTMGIRSEFFSRLLGSGGQGLSELTHILMASHSMSVGVDYRECAMDEDTLDRLPDGDWLKSTLNNNDWLVVLYLMHQAEMPEEFVK